MSQSEQLLLHRLGLLLAGGGRRCRRLVAALDPQQPAIDGLRTTAAPQALLASARHLAAGTANDLLGRLEADGWRWLIPASNDFPDLLRQCSDPPLGLFVRGRLPAGPMVSVVGSRSCTGYGRQVARTLGEQLAAAGVAVVSGMARGIDGVTHSAVLRAGGRTVAVWGTGPDQIYPAEHRDLAEQIAANGALVTEYPPGTPPRRHHFPERNRIIAGMATAVVIVEAAARSGALITARLALEEGRDVLAVPGSIFSEQSLGPNALLRHGARPLLGVRDLLEELPGADPTAPAGTGRPEQEETGLLCHLAEPATVDELAARTGQQVPELLTQLLELELSSSVVRLDDGRYGRR